MKTLNWMVAAALVAVAAGTANAAVPREYVTGGDVLVVYCDDGSCPGIGGGGYAAGELVPDAAGEAALSIADDLSPAVGAFYCQDFNDDSLCGDDGTVSGTVESAQSFCIDLTLDDGSVSGLGNWNTLYGVVIFVDGPILGLPTFSECAALAPGTHGFINA